MDLPIPRWLCQRKGLRQSTHRTFSLLPHPLIPYHSFALNDIQEVVRFKDQTDKTLEQTKSYISCQGLTTDLSLENNQIYNFQHLFSEAYSKLNAVAEIKQLITEEAYTSQGPIDTVLKFVEGYQSPFLNSLDFQASNIEKLALDYFFQFQSGPYMERHFLFGTPSQKRLFWNSDITSGGDSYALLSIFSVKSLYFSLFLKFGLQK